MTVALTAPAAETEQELIQTAQAAVSRCNWVIGRCAAEWTRRYARGRTDADFGSLVGLSADQVYQRRRVWETFADVSESYGSLRWSHFYVALTWDDAPECLQWSEENGATVAEMRAWRRATRGDELADESDETDEPSLADEPGLGRLAGIASDVRDPDGEGYGGRRNARESDDDDRMRDDDDPPFVPGSVSSAHRETNGDDYAPFRKDAGSVPPETQEETADERPVAQIARRVISTLERIGTVLTPQVVASFRTLPEKDRARLRAALAQLNDRVSGLS